MAICRNFRTGKLDGIHFILCLKKNRPLLYIFKHTLICSCDLDLDM